MLGGGLQSSILAAYQQELVEAETLYEQCLELILRFAFHLLRLRLATWSCGVACRRQVIKSHGASPLPPGKARGCRASACYVRISNGQIGDSFT